MNRPKLIAAAAALPLLGLFLFQPVWLSLFTAEVRVFGLPLQVVYIFVAWLGLIGGAACLSRPLARIAAPGPDDDPGRDAPP